MSVTDKRIEFIRLLAKKYNLSNDVVEAAVTFPFEFTASEMKVKQNTRPIYHLHLGKILVKPNREFLYIKTKEERLAKKHAREAKRDLIRDQKLRMEGSVNGEDSSPTSIDMFGVS